MSALDLGYFLLVCLMGSILVAFVLYMLHTFGFRFVVAWGKRGVPILFGVLVTPGRLLNGGAWTVIVSMAILTVKVTFPHK